MSRRMVAFLQFNTLNDPSYSSYLQIILGEIYETIR